MVAMQPRRSEHKSLHITRSTPVRHRPGNSSAGKILPFSEFSYYAGGKAFDFFFSPSPTTTNQTTHNTPLHLSTHIRHQHLVFSYSCVPVAIRQEDQCAPTDQSNEQFTAMDSPELVQRLVKSFTALAAEVEVLQDRKTILEHKLRYAHEQVCNCTILSTCHCTWSTTTTTNRPAKPNQSNLHDEH